MSPAGHRRDRMQLAIKNQPVCFAHGGFAVAGASNESQVHLWDAERGNRLLSLDHHQEKIHLLENGLKVLKMAF